MLLVVGMFLSKLMGLGVKAELEAATWFVGVALGGLAAAVWERLAVSCRTAVACDGVALSCAFTAGLELARLVLFSMGRFVATPLAGKLVNAATSTVLLVGNGITV